VAPNKETFFQDLMERFNISVPIDVSTVIAQDVTCNNVIMAVHALYPS
jgi:hypothetical protein